MAIVPLFLLLACGGGDAEAPGDEAAAEAPAPVEAEAPAPEAAPAFTAPTLDPGMDMCLGAVDCVAVQLSCCSACEGGVVVAVNKTRVDEVKEKFAQTGCDTVTCQDADCPPAEVECSMGCKIAGD